MVSVSHRIHDLARLLRDRPDHEDDVHVEYIDLYLLHDPLLGTEKRLNAYRALCDMQKEGKIRSIGVSN